MSTVIPLKERLRAALIVTLEAELAGATASQRVTQEGATHPEAKPEGDKDTRAIEASYLARGLATRVAGLRDDIVRVRVMALKSFEPHEHVGLSAIVQVIPEDGPTDGPETTYFIALAGGGTRLEAAGTTYIVVTPYSPLGKALIGRVIDDEVRVESPRGPRLSMVVSIS